MDSTPHAPTAAHDPVGDGDRPWFKFYPPNVPRCVEPVSENSLSELVSNAASRYGDAPAFTNLGGQLTFNEVDDLATRFAAYLQKDLGLVKGDRIVIQMPNLLQYPVAFFGALRAGLIVVNANPLYTPSEMKEIFADATPRALVVLANFAYKAEAELPDSGIEHVIVTQVGDLLPQPKRSIVNFVATRVKKMVPDYNLPKAIAFRDTIAQRGRKVEGAIRQDDVALLQYTGGTTGGTKAAVLTNSNLLYNQEQFIGQMRTILGDGPTTVIAALPLYHVFALTVNLLGFFRFGSNNVLITNPRDLPGFVKTIKNSRPEALLLVNTLALALLENEAFRALNFSSMKVTVAGGMALRTDVAQRWTSITNSPIIEGYGLTEASPVVSVNPTHLPPRVGTIGVPLPSTDVRIVDDEGNIVTDGSPGELAVKGPQVMRGYWNNPEETAAVLTEDGWLLTGDIATIDDDGYMCIVDRKKEIIIVSGFNVYPGEIEDTATLHPGVIEAGAIGVDDENAGEVPKLFVVRRDDTLTETELKAFLKERLAGYKRPRHIRFVDELPKTNVGKVLRRELREIDGD